MLNTIKNKRRIYERGAINYGALTLLFMLDINLRKGNEWECKTIFSVMKEHYAPYNIAWPQELNEQSIHYMKEVFYATGLTGNIDVNNLPTYAEALQTQLDKLVD